MFSDVLHDGKEREASDSLLHSRFLSHTEYRYVRPDYPEKDLSSTRIENGTHME